jgi:uncharacterized membrane protein
MDPVASFSDAPSYRPELRIGPVISRAWNIYKNNLGIVLGATAVYLLIIFVLSGGELLGLGMGLQLTGNLLVIILGGPLTVGYYGIMMRLVRGEEANIGDLFDGFQHFGRAVGVYLLMSLATLVGLILLIVPGIIVAVGLWPSLYLVYDERHGVVETLQRAWELTRGHKLELFVLGIVLILIGVLGLLAFVVGLILTVAFVYVAAAVAYEELSLGAS